MINFNKSAIKLYRQLFGCPDHAGQLADGLEMVLDGNTAIAVTEAAITEVAILGAGFSDQVAALSWLSEQQRLSCNLFDQKLQVQYADSPRGSLAIAIGVTMSGHRSTVFLSAADMASCQDLLYLAVARHLPLVIHLDNQLLAKQGNSSGSGHEVVHQVMDSGCIVLFATNVQQAVDFTLIARNIAEISLTPVIVVMDGVETALSVQNVRLPSRDLVLQFIGRANDVINTPSIAQKQLFSDSRSRLQRWHDLDKPVLQGAMLNPEIAALGNAASQVYFDQDCHQQLATSYAFFAKLTARKYHSISSYALKKADIIFIAQGSAVETLITLSKFLQQPKKITSYDSIHIGVIGLHSLRPFDAASLVELLTHSKQVVVLDRCHIALADDAPLIREIRAAMQKKRSAIEQIEPQPQLHSIIYGLAGLELDMRDLIELCIQIKAQSNVKSKTKSDTNTDIEGRYLGIHFNLSKGLDKHPKHQVTLDVLSRYYPQINKLGINAEQKPLVLTATNSSISQLNIAVSYLLQANETFSYTLDLAGYLHKLTGHALRSLIAPSWPQWATRQTDYLTQSEQALAAASSTAVDYFIVIDADISSLVAACQQLNHHGALLMAGFDRQQHLTLAENSQWQLCQQLIKEKNLSLYHCTIKHSELAQLSEKENTQSLLSGLLWEKLLANLTALLIQTNKLTLKKRKILSIRQQLKQQVRQGSESYIEVDKASILAHAFSYALDNYEAIYEAREIDNLLAFSYSQVSDKHSLNDSQLIKAKMLNNLAQVSNGYDSLPGFSDRIGAQPCADPFLATAIVPSLTASFNNIGDLNNNNIPVFNPLLCTACGACWSNCPDSAIAVVAISPKALINSAINSTGSDSLRQVAAKFASQIGRQCRKQGLINKDNESELKDTLAAGHAGDLLTEAFNWLKEKSGLSADRLQVMTTDYNKVYTAIADLPIVTSDLLFYSQEKQENGSGELFSLVINPQSCKSCGLCIELCQPQALTHDAVNNVLLDKSSTVVLEKPSNAKDLWRIWQQLPDTLSTTIERIKRDQLMPTGAALMLSRHHAFALSGGDLAEPASAEKIALRQILSGVEYHQQPLLSRFIATLEQLREQLTQAINKNLSQALPTDNLTQLANKLSDIKTRRVDLNDLLDSSTQLMDHSAIDAAKIRELINYVLQLNELLYKLSTGSYGLGRSRYSLCISSTSISRWAGSFPHNPFHVPVNIDITGEGAQIASGLVQGQINDLLGAISLERKSRASVASVNSTSTKNTQLDLLQWSDLSLAEQQLCPPLLLVGGDEILAGQGLAQISLLLNSSYPIKIVIFSELDSGLVASAHIDSANDLALMAMSQRNAYVAQTSIADNSHLQQCVHEMLNFNATALLRIYTPSPSKHGFKPKLCLSQASLAIKTRMSPLFRYNPLLDGVFGSRLSLQGNDDLSLDWIKLEDNHRLTPIDWAINEKRFQEHFSILSDSVDKAPFATEIVDWLKLSVVDQNKKTPYFNRRTDQGVEKIAISKKFANMVKSQQQLWRSLQELAGIVTPFTAEVEKTIVQRLAGEHQRQLDSLKKQYEEKLIQLEENYNAQTHTKIRNQLLLLSGYDVSHCE